jgi:protein-S-isoprenylcysteine O-methyltransferase Ste14
MCAPVVMLGKRWLIGECLALSACMVPGLLLARWTRDCRNVKRRALLQAVCFSGLFLLSTAAVANASGRLERLTHIASFHLHLLAIVFFLAALPGLSAVQEFAAVGQGTPLPFDPPRQLVRSGIYRYIANPMQSSTALLLIVMAIGLRLPWLLLGSLVSVVYSAGLAHWDEDSDLRQRYGQRFLDYRMQVRNWLPRWRPVISQTARIYLAEDCFKCSQMAAFLKSLKPIGLEIVAAEDHPRRNLERMTYESEAFEGGVEDAGLAALARALEHVNLGVPCWAWHYDSPASTLHYRQSLMQAAEGRCRWHAGVANSLSATLMKTLPQIGDKTKIIKLQGNGGSRSKTLPRMARIKSGHPTN